MLSGKQRDLKKKMMALTFWMNYKFKWIWQKKAVGAIAYELCWAAFFYKRWLKTSIKEANATNGFQALTSQASRETGAKAPGSSSSVKPIE